MFAAFFAQLLNADPGKLLDVMIDKGDERRAAFDRASPPTRAAAASVRNRGRGALERRKMMDADVAP